MRAFVINDMQVTDPALLEDYDRMSPATVPRQRRANNEPGLYQAPGYPAEAG